MTVGLLARARSVSAVKRGFLLTLLGATALPSIALAQSTPVISRGADSVATPELSEIVVTAQKRSENVQTVPVAITVVRPDQLDDAGVHNFQDLSSVSPSLTITGNGNGQNSSVVMRGVGTYSFSYLTEPDVAIILDDIPVASQSQAFSNLLDVSQIEVLRGPQTTLFGKSSSAGAVIITTEAPTNVFSGKVATSFTGDGEETFSASFSGPLTDTLSFRLTGAIDDFKGNVKNIYNGTWTNGEDTDSIRAKFRWAPSDALTIDLTGSYMHADGSLGLPQVPINVPPTAVIYTGLAGVAYAGLNINDSNHSIKNDVNPVLNYDIAQGSVKIAYDVGPLTVMSITGYSDYQTYNLTDFDATALNVLSLETAGALSGGLTQVFNEETKQFSQEFRAVSGPGPFRYVAGLWFADKTDYYTTVRGPLFPGLGTHIYANYWYNDYSRQYAAYGQSEWDIAPAFTLVTGLRLNDEQIGYDYDNVFKSFPSHGSHSQPAVTGKVSLEYRPQENLNLYASYTRGYKGETYDLTSSFNAALAAHGPVLNETSNSYELGAKTQFFNRRLTVNVTAFDADYSNFQAQTIVPVLGTGFVLANVGSLETRGFELDGRVRLAQGFTIDFAGAYLDARISNYPNGQCYYLQTAAQGCIGGAWNLAGQSLPNAPKFKGNLDVQYTNGIPDTRFEGVLTASVRAQSSVNYALSPDPMTEQAGYAVVNLSAAIQPNSGAAYKIGVFVNNVFDTHYYAGKADLSSFSQANSIGVVPRDFGRYEGLRASYEF